MSDWCVGPHFTFMVAVLSIRALSALKAAGGHTVDDALSGPRLTVFATVRERHLEDDRKVPLEQKIHFAIYHIYHYSLWKEKFTLLKF